MSKIRKSARDQVCTMRTKYCNHDPATTVLAHSPFAMAGMGRKASDLDACYSCSSCHDILDRRVWSSYSRQELQSLFTYAKARTHAVLKSEGLI